MKEALCPHCYNGTIKYRDGIFICEACQQKVTIKGYNQAIRTPCQTYN